MSGGEEGAFCTALVSRFFHTLLSSCTVEVSPDRYGSTKGGFVEHLERGLVWGAQWARRAQQNHAIPTAVLSKRIKCVWHGADSPERIFNASPDQAKGTHADPACAEG